jgi:cytochrome c-type biogenesis protein CcmH/NrfF
VSARRLVATLVAALILLAAAAVGSASPAQAAVSFPQAQQQFNCTICHEPLNEAHSGEAFEENTTLRTLIAKGESMAQIKRGMVANYGIAVLANPPKHGFAALIVVIPVAVIVLGLLVLAFTIPRWRRRAAQQAREPRPSGPAISEADEERLAADLARGDE